MKRASILFWKGLTRFLSSIAEWFTVILGMKDDSMYGKILRRIVGTCFTLLVLLGTSAAVVGTYEGIAGAFNDDSDGFYDVQDLSKDLIYYVRECGEDGYVENVDGKKMIKGISWISKPLGEDSLVCYSDGKKCGYFNQYTGEVVIEPQYAYAWRFSEGVAAVNDDGWVKFIDGTGKVVIDPRIPYCSDVEGYVFYNKHCVVHKDRRDRFGLLDKQGKWALDPEYLSIIPCDTFWILDNGKEQSVITDDMQTVIPFFRGYVKLDLNEQTILATLEDHTVKTFTLQGEVIDDFCIQNVETMTYDTEKRDADGLSGEEYDEAEATPAKAIARCKRYEAESYWYGLMSPEGKILTPPSYLFIEAIGADLYFCKKSEGSGVLLNGKGEKIE